MSLTSDPARVVASGEARRGCAAADVQLHFAPNGDVSACCRNTVPLGNIGRDRLTDLWAGAARRDLVTRLDQEDWSAGCLACGEEVGIEGRDVAFLQQFDRWAEVKAGAAPAVDMPVRMDFNLSSSCNLQCIQCNGESSTSIRIHREHKPPLPRPYGDQFFADIVDFLPHLRHAAFAGGEPFMGAETFRMWELIAEHAPGLDVTICTNATQWGDKVERVLEQLRPAVILSIDGFTKETFEAVRVSADHEEAFANIERFREVTRRHDRPLDINFCLMRQNFQDMGPLILFAEERGIHFNVSVVRGPEDCTIAALPSGEIRAIADELHRQSEDVLPRLTLNRGMWLMELARVDAWARIAAEDEVSVGISRFAHRSILSFSNRGRGPVDDVAARAELASFAADGTVHAVVVDFRNAVASITPGLAEILGLDPTAVIGAGVGETEGWFTARFGPRLAVDVLLDGPDRYDAVHRFDEVEVRIVMLPLRDETGNAFEGELLFAMRSMQ